MIHPKGLDWLAFERRLELETSQAEFEREHRCCIPQCSLAKAELGPDEDGRPIWSDFCTYHGKVMRGLLQPLEPMAYPTALRDRIERRERDRLEQILELVESLG